MSQPLPGGYQPPTANGAKIRADVVDVYVFTRVARTGSRESAASRSPADGPLPYEKEPGWPKAAIDAPEAIYFLQLLRAGAPLDNTWQPVMGHVEAGETSVACALREIREELGLEARDPAVRGVWALEQVHPFYIAAIDAIVLSPRFCVEVAPEWSVKLNYEHAEFRWVREDEVDAMFMWPGQKAACREILREIVRDESLSREWIKISDF